MNEIINSISRMTLTPTPTLPVKRDIKKRKILYNAAVPVGVAYRDISSQAKTLWEGLSLLMLTAQTSKFRACVASISSPSPFIALAHLLSWTLAAPQYQ